YSLGRVMGELYERELENVDAISDEAKRQAAIERAERQYRAPALKYLRESRGADIESPEFLEALIALYDKRYDDALMSAQAASARTPWLTEARELEVRLRAMKLNASANAAGLLSVPVDLTGAFNVVA